MVTLFAEDLGDGDTGFEFEREVLAETTDVVEVGEDGEGVVDIAEVEVDFGKGEVGFEQVDHFVLDNAQMHHVHHPTDQLLHILLTKSLQELLHEFLLFLVHVLQVLVFNLVPLQVLVQTEKVIDFLYLSIHSQSLFHHFVWVLYCWKHYFDALVRI